MGGGGAGGRAAQARTDLASGAASPDPAALGRRDRPDGPLSPRRGPVRLGGSGAAGLRAWGAGRGASGPPPASPGGELGQRSPLTVRRGPRGPPGEARQRLGEEGAGCWGHHGAQGRHLGFASGTVAAGEGYALARALGRGWLSGRGGGIPRGPPCERLGELFSPWRLVVHPWRGSHRVRGGRSAAGCGTVSAVSAPTLSGCAKPGYRQVSHLYSVEPPGAKIRMFRFMRDVEPEDPMFLM